MGGELPRRADADGDVQGDGQRDRRCHLGPDELFDGLLLAGGDLEEEFVVDLHRRREANPASLSAEATSSMAILTMSAALP